MSDGKDTPEISLPELPPKYSIGDDSGHAWGYEDGDMQAYARAAVIADRARSAAVAEGMVELLQTFTDWARQVAAREDVPRGIRSAAANLHDDGKRRIAASPTPVAIPKGEGEAGKHSGPWSVFNSGGACIIENVTFTVAAEYMTADRFARGWNMVSVIATQEQLQDEESRAEPVAVAAVGASEPWSEKPKAKEWLLPPPSWRLLAKAAIELLWAIDEKHDTKTPPLKYSIPYGAVNGLRIALGAAEDPEVTQPPHEADRNSGSGDADTKRLDWLDEHADVILPKAVQFETLRGVFIWSTRPGNGELREAIDAATKPAIQSGEGGSMTPNASRSEAVRLAEECKREARHLFDLAPDAEDMAHLSLAIDRLAALVPAEKSHERP